ncbi:tetratricopeptide repeat protein [Streptomyces sp. NPDC056512]|uniref:tetratricopeptide repeat protein n=1 Tax=Streptomyces sp. NPDC056512 TaxID=3345846 RepID=UPI00369D7E4B
MTASSVALHQQNVTDRERVLGTDHPDTLGTRNNLANARARAAQGRRWRFWLWRRG